MTISEPITFSPEERIRHYRLINPSNAITPAPGTMVPLGRGGSSVVYLTVQILHEATSILRAIKFFVRLEDLLDLAPNAGAGPISNRESIS